MLFLPAVVSVKMLQFVFIFPTVQHLEGPPSISKSQLTRCLLDDCVWRSSKQVQQGRDPTDPGPELGEQRGASGTPAAATRPGCQRRDWWPDLCRVTAVEPCFSVTSAYFKVFCHPILFQRSFSQGHTFLMWDELFHREQQRFKLVVI